MSKFRKRAIIIDAQQWFPERPVEGVLTTSNESVTINGSSYLPGHYGVIKTLEDTSNSFHFVIPGDWIITGIKGEKYPCKNDIFQQTYEKVENE